MSPGQEKVVLTNYKTYSRQMYAGSGVGIKCPVLRPPGGEYWHIINFIFLGVDMGLAHHDKKRQIRAHHFVLWDMTKII